MAERVRGTANISLNDEGRAQVLADMKLLKKLGGLDILYYSNLRRCVQTAKILAPAVMHLKNLGSKLDPWHLGKFEGQEAEKVKDKIEYYIFHPDEIVPGNGYHAPGESFNQFKERFLSVLAPLLAASKNKKIGIVVNYRTHTLSKAWLYAGAKGLDIVMSAMFGLSTTGGILYIDPLNIDCFSIDEFYKDKLRNGVYEIRHGETDWNENAFSSNGNNGPMQPTPKAGS